MSGVYAVLPGLQALEDGDKVSTARWLMKSAAIGKLWTRLRDLASMSKVEEGGRMIPDISLGPSRARAHTYTAHNSYRHERMRTTQAYESEENSARENAPLEKEKREGEEKEEERRQRN